MKRLLICSFIAAFFSVYTPVSAQVADTTSAWRYLPLHEANVWEYEYWIEECITWDFCTTELIGSERWTVTSDSIAAGTLYKKLSVYSFSADDAPVGSTVHLVRFDTLAAQGYRRVASGEEVYWPGELPCRLDVPFGPETTCSDGWDDVLVDGPWDVQVVVAGEEAIRQSKQFLSLISWSEYIVDIGLHSDGAAEFGGRWVDLTYARNGDIVYGSERFPVAGEAPVAQVPTISLAAYPNPARDATTLTFALDHPQRTALSVYDVLGRRVLTDDLGILPVGEHTHRLRLGTLRSGVYIVRLSGDAGAAVTARLSIQ